MKFKFSAPLPFKKDNIDELILINTELNESKITSLYFALHSNCSLHTGFEQTRYNSEINNFSYWAELINYSITKGFDFIYLINSPRQFESYDLLLTHLKKLDILLKQLENLNVNKLRVTNPQLIDYIVNKYPKFDIYASILLDFKTIKEYVYFLDTYKDIKQVTISCDNNKNFKLLENLKSRYPFIDFELLVNQGCLTGCPYRKFHSIYENNYYIKKCEQSFSEYLCRNDCIYPFEIKEYEKIGFYNFKFTGRQTLEFHKGDYIKYFYYYLKGIEDYKFIENLPIKYFNNYIINSKFEYRVKDIKKYLPQIKYFKKHGHLCNSICSNGCKYCFNCAKKIEQIFEQKLPDKNNKQVLIPVCKI